MKTDEESNDTVRVLYNLNFMHEPFTILSEEKKILSVQSIRPYIRISVYPKGKFFSSVLMHSKIAYVLQICRLDNVAQ